MRARFWSLMIGFLKQGKASCGVARQYTGSAGKITNCRIGVFAAMFAAWPCPRALCLPKGGWRNPLTSKAAHVPSDVDFATKPKIRRRMIARAIAALCPPPQQSFNLARPYRLSAATKENRILRRDRRRAKRSWEGSVRSRRRCRRQAAARPRNETCDWKQCPEHSRRERPS
ncbi:transposase [Bradyrhizobium sp. 160]|nr:transposase [Bradyrhizobium sp. 160]